MAYSDAAVCSRHWVIYLYCVTSMAKNMALLWRTYSARTPDELRSATSCVFRSHLVSALPLLPTNSARTPHGLRTWLDRFRWFLFLIVLILLPSLICFVIMAARGVSSEPAAPCRVVFLGVPTRGTLASYSTEVRRDRRRTLCRWFIDDSDA